MNLRSFLAHQLLFVAILTLSSLGTHARGADRPNVLFIMSDDHAAHAISAYQGRLAEIAPTPNIDRLAKEGALFTNAFCTNSICSPSRACVLTGQYDHTNGAFDLGGRVSPGNQMLAIEMKKAGYETAMIGKWHLKDEPADFDYYCVLPGQGKYHNPDFRVRGDKPWGKNLIHFKDKHVTDAITDLSLEWLSEDRDQSKPFFLMHHYKAPHDYFDNAERYESYLRDVNIPEPETLWKRDPQFGSLATRGANDELIPHIGTSIGGRNPRRSYLGDLPELYPAEFPADFDPADFSDEENTRLAYNAYLKKYLRCVKGIDDNLGRLFKYLEDSGQMDNTLIIYTGDQGFMLGEHDYQDKRWMYEQSQRMPFLVRYPKQIAAGQQFDTIIENVDYGPTMLDFAGAEIPTNVQGRSFRSLLEDGEEPDGWKQEAYYRYWMHMAHHDNPGHLGIRTKTHKLIYYYGCNYDGGYQTPAGWELYDLVNDPMETRNVIDEQENRELVSELKNRLAELRTRVGDDGSHFPDCEAIVQEFWDYDEADRAKAIEVSHEYLKRRQAELKAGKANVQTWVGK
ncbi:sulfatase family protein [Allorhodopirellula heiligendammensis]|uniref:Arylsulfatase n=1 Tax=Allorhodopirellula heiligendammensis TaxID=2714739 RepID=A0A5C6C6B2_9BACT|nr:sulfatase [Allorhodopirellula heiligendammensis]TWU19021.1 Arylsulfatase [Allorhodopirellula heiligendammensis]